MLIQKVLVGCFVSSCFLCLCEAVQLLMFSVQKSNWFRFLFKYYSQEWKWQSNSKSIHYTTVSENITLNSLWSRKMPTFIYKILIINENICYFPFLKCAMTFFCRSKDIKHLLVSFMYLQSLLQPKNRWVLLLSSFFPNVFSPVCRRSHGI